MLPSCLTFQVSYSSISFLVSSLLSNLKEMNLLYRGISPLAPLLVCLPRNRNPRETSHIIMLESSSDPILQCLNSWEWISTDRSSVWENIWWQMGFHRPLVSYPLFTFGEDPLRLLEIPYIVTLWILKEKNKEDTIWKLFSPLLQIYFLPVDYLVTKYFHSAS